MRDTKNEVLKFWFEETQPQQWFQKNDAFDADIRDRFMVTYDMARKDMCQDWARDAEGVLALVIVLDQFPRNMFRGDPKMFATDSKALLIVKEALHKGFDHILPTVKRRFVYMPFMHSEELKEQKRSVALFESMKEDEPLSYEYALKHMEVIEKFGRFPHRNVVLGRESTQEELGYLKLPGAGF
ncbi:MAG: DUF924 family protein [Alphaproteobacteria bacterium]|nr:DUF924 family protein [Alphaproteobacteria bacterium]